MRALVGLIAALVALKLTGRCFVPTHPRQKLVCGEGVKGWATHLAEIP